MKFTHALCSCCTGSPHWLHWTSGLNWVSISISYVYWYTWTVSNISILFSCITPLTSLLSVSKEEILLVFLLLIPNTESAMLRELFSLVYQIILHVFLHKLKIIYLCYYIYIQVINIWMQSVQWQANSVSLKVFFGNKPKLEKFRCRNLEKKSWQCGRLPCSAKVSCVTMWP